MPFDSEEGNFSYPVHSSINSHLRLSFTIRFDGVGSFDSIISSSDSEFEFDKLDELIYLWPC